MPPGTVVAPVPNATTTCAGGTLTAAATATAVGLSAGTRATVSGDQPCGSTTCSATAAPVAIVAPVLNVVITINGLQCEMVVAGQIVTYAMTVTNMSAVTATNVDLIDTAPAGATPIPGTVTFGGQPDATVRATRTTAATSTVSGQTVNVPIGTLAGGASIVITFRAPGYARTAFGYLDVAAGRDGVRRSGAR
jgi:uncharacterized repeat protein (TIGR01451 family)